MCGILGYIGNSTNRAASFDLVNQLMIKTESRGEHATGFWAALGNGDKRIMFHKEPIKSSVFVWHEMWLKLQDCEEAPNILLGHCRWTSPGGGPENVNKNNHPHVSKDCRIALVHNGKIPEYSYLKKHYDITTGCDSEVLLRIFESGEDFHDQAAFLRKDMPKIWADTPDDLLYRIYGLKKIISEVNYGSMAVAIGERLEGNARSLFLLHNEQRPLVMVDLRESLGQIFFCSTPELFRQAYDDSTIAKTVVPQDQAVITLPHNWIYSLFVDNDNTFSLRRIKINKQRKYGYWDNNKSEEKVIEPEKSITKFVRSSEVDLITSLDENEEPIERSKKNIFGSVITTNNNSNKFPLQQIHPYDDCADLSVSGDVEGSVSSLRRENAVSSDILMPGNGFQEVRKPADNPVQKRYDYISTEEEDEQGNNIASDSRPFSDLCEKALSLIKQLDTCVQNSVREGSVTTYELEDLVDGMQEVVADLEATKCLMHI